MAVQVDAALYFPLWNIAKNEPPFGYGSRPDAPPLGYWGSHGSIHHWGATICDNGTSAVDYRRLGEVVLQTSKTDSSYLRKWYNLTDLSRHRASAASRKPSSAFFGP
ncbi:uncharacterized protein BO95DRAFT_468929 [Aspergillus brunneoviolaceus CBS 621.78]|uniref:Uncharacterized protein n=1 Tax=Aspergillus brunneoviolaceus CBS 621.78 TaxID=1450534 RepID=A0ACD1FTH9_9EURO|nr:hypothetical protein BO95DRAFT_468929 [Aspergillus brunneoviolaceus CBS 621.78]RAH40301.1 hypothetical protein BO95DRAFT_468929 [Aspergillus brunneoviolaceus CBS 621.78]